MAHSHRHHPQSLEDTQLYQLAFSLASVAASGAVAALLVCRTGRRLGLRLMYLLAALSGVVVLQVRGLGGQAHAVALQGPSLLPEARGKHARGAGFWPFHLRFALILRLSLAFPPACGQGVLIVYAGDAGLWLAATVLGALYIRQSMVGLLSLHTLPSRETYTVVRTLQVRGSFVALPENSLAPRVPGRMSFPRAPAPSLPAAHLLRLSQAALHSPARCTLQVVLGSLAIVMGLCVGGTTLSAAKGWSVAGAYEALRLLLVGAMLALHRRENIAKP